MALFTATITNLGYAKLTRYWGGLLAPFEQIAYFKVGEGGWVDPGTGREPRVPDPALLDLDILVDVSRAPGDKRYNVGENFGYFQKALIGLDFSEPGAGILRVSCLLLNGDYNLKSDGVLVYNVGGPYISPEIWEIGLYDGDGDMIFYGTFAREIKDATRMIENVCRIVGS